MGKTEQVLEILSTERLEQHTTVGRKKDVEGRDSEGKIQFYTGIWRNKECWHKIGICMMK
jgi:hypothetical protein